MSIYEDINSSWNYTKKKKTFCRTKPVFYFRRIYFLSQTTSAGGVAVHRLAQKIMSTRKNGCARETREGSSLPRVSPLHAGFFLHPLQAPVTREARAIHGSWQKDNSPFYRYPKTSQSHVWEETRLVRTRLLIDYRILFQKYVILKTIFN